MKKLFIYFSLNIIIIFLIFNFINFIKIKSNVNYYVQINEKNISQDKLSKIKRDMLYEVCEKRKNIEKTVLNNVFSDDEIQNMTYISIYKCTNISSLDNNNRYAKFVPVLSDAWDRSKDISNGIVPNGLFLDNKSNDVYVVLSSYYIVFKYVYNDSNNYIFKDTFFVLDGEVI